MVDNLSSTHEEATKFPQFCFFWKSRNFWFQKAFDKQSTVKCCSSEGNHFFFTHPKRWIFLCSTFCLKMTVAARWLPKKLRTEKMKNGGVPHRNEFVKSLPLLWLLVTKKLLFLRMTWLLRWRCSKSCDTILSRFYDLLILRSGGDIYPIQES